MTPEEVQALLEGMKSNWERVAEAVKRLSASPVSIRFFVLPGITAIPDAGRAVIAEATTKERHYILHAKKWRVRKKYYDRARRRMLARVAREETT